MNAFKAIGCVALLVALAGSAQGQDAPARKDDRPPLQGPAVQQNRPPHLDDQFGDGMKGGKENRREPMIPMRAYAEVIGKLRGDKAPEGLRLTEEQEHKVGAIEQEFREAAKEFAQRMREERGSNGPPPAAGEKGKNGDQGPRREMAQEMMKNGPKPGDYQTKVWAVLNEKQQAFVKTELDKVRDELQKKRGEEMMQRRINEKRGVKGDAQDQKNVQPTTSENGPPIRERAQRIMRRMAQLPAEDRERILKRLEEELDRRGIPNDPPPPPPPPKDQP